MKTPAEHQPGVEREVIRPRRGEGGELHLVRDVLDKEIVDCERDPIARVDGVVLAIPDEGQPWIVRLESGPLILARRLGHWPQRIVGSIARRFGPNGGVPMRINWSHILRIGLEVMVDMDADEAPALATEHWLLNHVTRHIPSLKSEKKDESDQQDPGQVEAQDDASLPPPASKRSGFHRVRLQDVVGAQVRDTSGKAIGRIEEVRTRVGGGQCYVEQYVLGREGWLERLSIADLSLAAVRVLGARHGSQGKEVPWQQMELKHVDGRLSARLNSAIGR